MARDALQRAHLFSPDRANFGLFIEALALENSYRYDVSFAKPVLDQLSGEARISRTWEQSGVGHYKPGGDFVLGTIRQAVEKFVSEFLRVNASACRR